MEQAALLPASKVSGDITRAVVTPIRNRSLQALCPVRAQPMYRLSDDVIIAREADVKDYRRLTTGDLMLAHWGHSTARPLGQKFRELSSPLLLSALLSKLSPLSARA
jgi:hypothetical protein